MEVKRPRLEWEKGRDGGAERAETTPAIGERVGGTGIGATEVSTGFPFKNEIVSDSLAAES